MTPLLNRWTGSALLAVALLATQAGRADEAKPMQFSRPYKSGAVTRYKTTIKTNVQGADIVIESTDKQTIKEIKENGNVVIQFEPLSSTQTVNGAEQPGMPFPPSTVTRDKRGKLVDYKQEDKPDFPLSADVLKLIASTNDVLLSDKPVKEEDSWVTEVENPAAKDHKVTVKTTYKGIEKINGADYWKFKQTAEPVVSADGSKAGYVLTAWIDPKDGLLYKMEGNVKDMPSTFGPVSFDVAMKQLVPEKADEKKDAKDDKKEEKKDK